jgi:hypothetical protein
LLGCASAMCINNNESCHRCTSCAPPPPPAQGVW